MTIDLLFTALASCTTRFPAGMVDSSDTSLLVEIHGTNEDVEDESYGGVDFQYPELGLNCQTRPTLQCTPEADAFNPCEDIAGRINNCCPQLSLVP